MTTDAFGREWRRQRAAELQGAGMARSAARAYAKAEARGRARIAKMTGTRAAEAGEIAMRHGRPVILIDPTLIPSDRRAAVRTFLFAHLSPAQ